MNSNKVFVSDFDGTFSKKDFYHMIIDKYLGQKGKTFYREWKDNKKIDVEFLNIIFSQINKSEDEIFNDIKSIPIDDKVVNFIKKCKMKKIDFYIVSAGTSYYIKKLLKHLDLNEIHVISMDGFYVDGGIKIVPNKEDKYYSDVFGIDKCKIIKDLKLKYDQVYFAGDSEPDYGAATTADLSFGKDELKMLLNKNKKEFIPFNNYGEIEKELMSRGVL